MQIEKMFYFVGGFFVLAAIIYFAWEYLIYFSHDIKTIILVCTSLFLFGLGNECRWRKI